MSFEPPRMDVAKEARAPYRAITAINSWNRIAVSTRMPPGKHEP
jgi:hypothetical protein